ncbi:hypothetical protein [Galbibacter pacificus]|uniref:Site-specific DNA-methyltransferase (cytosine-N(4)-specific) n=1 Tax=Galbibacter pacificus TaxID=2996052 RepID=A0ABT6FRM9_9FLAO|nr:hypothetical protein [Galbibacter pacificus]MDG3582947.1 hypothetical protein [Galbibacter pacificus]MDG3585934.1 hypothetical protein [Galbibacter pacificus]
MISTINLKKELSSISAEVLNGNSFDRNDYARKILNYPAMMVPSVQEPIIKTLIDALPENSSMIDPFMGASNTIITSMRYGINSFGQDINPLSLLISQVKTYIYSEDLKVSFSKLKKRIHRARSEKIDISFKNIDKWFKKEVQIELSQIRRLIIQEENLFIRKFYWVALAEVIRLTNNDRTSTFKMHIRKQEEIHSRQVSPVKYFLKVCKRSIDDVFMVKQKLIENDLIINDKYIYDVQVAWGDSKKKLNTNKEYNLLVTSPPYGDNHTTVTYGQFSYLPLQWIPVADIDSSIDMNYLDVIQEIDRRSLGGKLISDYRKIEEEYFDISNSLKDFFQGFTEEEKMKARKVVVFINDLSITIDNALKKMMPNSYMAWTVGNRNVNTKEVQNDSILIELMEHKGVQLLTDLDRDILSKRMPGKNNFSKTMNKEKILIFKV